MKKQIIIFTLLFSCFFLYAQQAGNYFYYYFEEKIYLTERSDKILIKLVKDADKQNILSLIQLEESIKFDILDEKALNLYVILEAKEGRSFTSETLNNFKENHNIISAELMFEYRNGMLGGLNNEFVVKLKPTTSLKQLQHLTSEQGCEIVRENKFVKNKYVISIPKGSELNAMQMANLFYETELFEFSKPNFALINALHSNDIYFPIQWALKNTGQTGGTLGIDIKAEGAWTITKGNSFPFNIKVAVVDVGVDLTHPDLQLNLLPGYDATELGTNGGPYTDDDNHGTACAGIIGAIQDNEKGISGVAPGCKIIPIKAGYIYKNDSFLLTEWLADAISWAYLNGADVISNSWGGGDSDPDITNAINNAVNYGRLGNKGCVVVFSSGNDNNNVNYPASLPNVIAVGAIDKCGVRAGRIDKIPQSCDPWCAMCEPGSSYGAGLNVVAPGTNIYTTDRQGNDGYNKSKGAIDYSYFGDISKYLLNDETTYCNHSNNYMSRCTISPGDESLDYYCCFGGTSAACPHVAGVAALVLSVNYNLTWQEVKNIIESTAQKIKDNLYTYVAGHSNGTWNEQLGYGLVDAHAAVLEALKTKCNYTSLPIVQGTITQNTVWNTPKYAYGTIIIPSGKQKAESNKNSELETKNSKLETITIYPNPGNDYITVVSQVENCLFELIDAIGTVQKSVRLHQGNNTINTSSLKQGIYIYRAVTDDKAVSGKWIKM